MTNVVKKVSINGQVVPFGAGGVVVETGESYTAGNGIDITSNEISVDTSTAPYDNSTSWASATNVQDAIDEVFQSVSNGKELIADAITDMWVSTSATDSFSDMSGNIRLIGGSTQEIERNEYWYDLLQAGQWTLLYFNFNKTSGYGSGSPDARSYSAWTEWYTFWVWNVGSDTRIICANSSFQITNIANVSTDQRILNVTVKRVEWEDDYIYLFIQINSIDPIRVAKLSKTNFTLQGETYDSTKTYIDITWAWPFVLRAIWWMSLCSTVCWFVAKMS